MNDHADNISTPRTPEATTRDLPVHMDSTPIRSKGSHNQSRQYEDLPLTQRRQMLGDQNGCFEDAPLNILWSVVPHVPDDKIEVIAAELRRLDVLNAENKWQDFAGKLGNSEHTAYDKPVEKIVNNIIELAHKVYHVERQNIVASDEMAADDPQTDAPAGYAGPRLALKCNGKTTHISEAPDSSKPDGSLAFTDTRRKSLTAVVNCDGKQDGKQGGKQGGKQDGKQDGKQGGRQGGKQGGKQGSKQGSKQGGKQGSEQGGKQDGKQDGKQEEEHDDRIHTENVLLCAQFKLHKEVSSNLSLRGCRGLLRLYRNTC
jgi:hypothetical protein